MKKWIKISLIVISVIILCVIIDLICIFTLNRPVFALKKDNYYVGLFYNTYNCPEFSIPQIKSKTSKFFCSKEKIGNIVDIVDTTKTIKNFNCAEALEQFYEDEENKYFYSCIKSKYIIVKYESGYQETVENALKNGTINISDLDLYNISYIVEKK